MKSILEKRVLLTLFFLSVFVRLFSQTNVPQGVNYQGIARNISGSVISSQLISVKIGIISGSSTGVLEWEEIHTVTTNQFGLFNIIIGQGISTGNGSASTFSSVNWSAANHFISTDIDQTGGTSFVAIDTVQFWSVPYAFQSALSDNLTNSIRLNDIVDVDTIGVVNGYVLKWDGTIWKPAVDNNNDTALFSYNSLNASTADTAMYSLNALSLVDTVNYSYYSDSSLYSSSSTNSVFSNSSNYCDTATYAFASGSIYSYWNLTGNIGTNPATNYLGTSDNNDFVIKTNSIERMRVLANGKIGVGVSNPTASLQLNGNDGLLALGNFGTGSASVLGAGTRMHWYPKKAAFRAGYVTGAQWDDVNIGNYSIASGNSNTASGAYSTSMGQLSSALGANSVAMGYGCIASNLSSISIGSACNAAGVYAIALGRGIISNDSASVGIGYHSNATGKFSLAFGAYTTASGDYSTTMGYYANSNGKIGSFVYADNSSTTATNSTADNQFVVRASGGFQLYSNTALTSGVSLPAGGGSWASVSDRNKKENFSKVDGEKILKAIEDLEVMSWNYKTQSADIKHIGPMAQDFYRLFNYGESDTTITSVDIDGVNLIALKTLALKTKELKKSSEEIAELKTKVENLEREKKLLEKRILFMEQKFISTFPASSATAGANK